MTAEIWLSLSRIEAHDKNLALIAQTRQKLRRRERRLMKSIVLALALAATLAGAMTLEQARKADGPSHTDKVQMLRLLDAID